MPCIWRSGRHPVRSQERGSRVVLEQVDAPDIAGEHVRTLVTTRFLDLQDRRAALRRAGDEPSAQAVTTELCGSSPAASARSLTTKATTAGVIGQGRTWPPRWTVLKDSPP